MEPLEQLTKDFNAHAEQDAQEFRQAKEERRQITKEVKVLHQKLADLATKDDIAELKNFMGNVNVGLGIFRFTWNNASKIGGAILFLFGVYGIIKYGVWGAAMWFFKLINGV